MRSREKAGRELKLVEISGRIRVGSRAGKSGHPTMPQRGS
jgi:hypothetical protein